jgi:hypothetical protein
VLILSAGWSEFSSPMSFLLLVSLGNHFYICKKPWFFADVKVNPFEFSEST